MLEGVFRLVPVCEPLRVTVGEEVIGALTLGLGLTDNVGAFEPLTLGVLPVEAVPEPVTALLSDDVALRLRVLLLVAVAAAVGLMLGLAAAEVDADEEGVGKELSAALPDGLSDEL